MVVVDIRPESLERGRGATATSWWPATRTDDAVLTEAGIGRARGLVTAIDSDANNVYVTLSARALNPGLFIVGRANAPGAEAKVLQAGANRVVSPYTMAGRRIAELALRPRVADFIDAALSHGELAFSMEEVEVGAGGPLDQAHGRRVARPTASSRSRSSAVRGPTRPNPPDERVLAVGETLIVSGSAEILRRCASAPETGRTADRANRAGSLSAGRLGDAVRRSCGQLGLDVPDEVADLVAQGLGQHRAAEPGQAPAELQADRVAGPSSGPARSARCRTGRRAGTTRRVHVAGPSSTSRRWRGGSASWRVATTSERTVMNLTFEATTATNRSGVSRTIDSQPGRIRPSAAGSSRIVQIASGVAPTSTLSTGRSAGALNRPPPTRRRTRLARTRPPPRRARRCGSARRRAGPAGVVARAGRRGRAPLRSGGLQPGGHEQRRPDDPRVVAQLGRHDRDADGQERDELVGVLADPTAQDEQVRAEQAIDRDEVLVEIGRPGLPRQAAADAGVGRRSTLRIPPADLHVAELGVRDEDAVDEEGRPDAGPEGQHEHRPAACRGRPRSASRRRPPHPRR